MSSPNPNPSPNTNPKPDNIYDPFGLWHSLQSVRDASLDAWAQGMVDLMNTEAYANTVGTMLDSYLSATAPLKQASEKAMVDALASANMPTRGDVVSLAQRLTNVEMRLDDLDAQVTEIMGLLRSIKGGLDGLAAAAARRNEEERAPAMKAEQPGEKEKATAKPARARRRPAARKEE